MVTHEGLERAKDYLENGSRPKPPSIEVDLTPIREMIDTAKANGVKFPRYRAQNLDITKAGDGSKNPGCLYVKTLSKEYQGKITAEGRFFAVRDARSDTVDNLKAIASDPLGSAMAYGISTGVCSCCGRVLTHPASIEKGIGPICAGHYGLDTKHHYKLSPENTPPKRKVTRRGGYVEGDADSNDPEGLVDLDDERYSKSSYGRYHCFSGYGEY